MKQVRTAYSKLFTIYTQFQERVEHIKKLEDKEKKEKALESLPKIRSIIIQQIVPLFDETSLKAEVSYKQIEDNVKLDFIFRWTSSRNQFNKNKSEIQEIIEFVASILNDRLIQLSDIKLKGNRKIFLTVENNEKN